MPFNATAYRVMIASPTDVQNERNIIRDVIHEWNAVNATDRATVLLPVAWETHSSPSMGARPQDVINRQVLADCDLLVAVFWTRIGTPTGEFQSGTVEEIEKHIAQGKEAMIYFSTAPVRLESVDGQQYEALLEFIQLCRDQGLTEEYDSLSEFKDKFRRQLGSTMITICGRSSAEPTHLRAADADAGTPVPLLSDEATQLLLAAAGDDEGTILVLRTSDGMEIFAGGAGFGSPGDRRSEAKWERAVNELLGEGLIVGRGHEGEVFEVTARGYEVGDLLRGSQT